MDGHGGEEKMGHLSPVRLLRDKEGPVAPAEDKYLTADRGLFGRHGTVNELSVFSRTLIGRNGTFGGSDGIVSVLSVSSRPEREMPDQVGHDGGEGREGRKGEIGKDGGERSGVNGAD